jgi:hypothetical protein
MRVLLFSLFFIVIAQAAQADPPMKVIYSTTTTTHFNWNWPYHPVQKYTSVQIKPYRVVSPNKVSYATKEDVSQYRFHNRHLTYQNQWGYFFPEGTKPVKNGNSAVVFGAPKSYYETISPK